MTEQDKSLSGAAAMAEHFGPLSLAMLNDSNLKHAWRVNFIANFFTGPIYRQIEDVYAITRPEFVILYCLQSKPGLVARDICLVTGLPKNSISRAVSDLLKRGFIERGTDTSDKRAKPLSLTANGAEILSRIVPLFEERQRDMRSPLSENEQAEFDRLIQKIAFGMPAWVMPE